jgi:hypothetical protein
LQPAVVSNPSNGSPNVTRFLQKKKTVWLDTPQSNSKVDAEKLTKRHKKRKMPNLLKTHTRTPEMVSNLED